MEKFSVKQLAKLAGVTVRTLHYYDEIGLLKPAYRAESKYRYYGKEELLKLQQILLYREMDFALSQITEILNDPGFDLEKALTDHLKRLKEKKKSVSMLIATVERTIVEFKNDRKMNYQEMYKGFSSQEEGEKLTAEAKQKWGEESINASHKKILSMNKKEWEDLQAETESVTNGMAKLMGTAVDSEVVQKMIARHYKVMASHFDVTLEIYRNIGIMYVEDERFTAYFEKYAPGLALFMCDAILTFCKDK